jgi:hypothetical protein
MSLVLQEGSEILVTCPVCLEEKYTIVLIPGTLHYRCNKHTNYYVIITIKKEKEGSMSMDITYR